jgi:hypothetical protein
MREDILGGLKNALERGESLESAKQSFILAGYAKADVEEAATSLENVRTTRKAGVPALYSATLQAPTAPAQAGETIKPLPQVKIKRTFNYWLVPPIIIVSAAIAYLIYSILLAQ